ncbi:MAG: sugar phosphate nucleotidyltransferase [Acidimicrobiia bacterium]
MDDSVAGVVLAAGAGTRLRPLTWLLPKALCPVGGPALVDHALARFDGTTATVAVNVHHGRRLLEAHLAGRAHLSIEAATALGTAGALGQLRDWVAGRPVVVVNADTWCPAPVGVLLDGWDGRRTRLLVPAGTTFGPRMTVAGALMPWPDVARLRPRPSGLYEAVWRDAADAGGVELVGLPPGTPLYDCGTPTRYLAANLAWSGGLSVLGAGAVVAPGAEVTRSVLWPGAVVGPGERLFDTVRAGGLGGLTVRCGSRRARAAPGRARSAR